MNDAADKLDALLRVALFDIRKFLVDEIKTADQPIQDCSMRRVLVSHISDLAWHISRGLYSDWEEPIEQFGLDSEKVLEALEDHQLSLPAMIRRLKGEPIPDREAVTLCVATLPTRVY